MVSDGGGEGEGLLRVAGVEGDAGGDAGVVGAAGAVLVGLGDGDGDRALRVLGEGDLDGHSAALGHGVGGLLELHVHVGGEVVVVDGDDGLVGGPLGHPGGQGRYPKVSLTDSPSSSTVSAVAVKVKDFSVSPLLKVTLAGTPE